MGGHMWGKRDLRIARNNQMIFIQIIGISPEPQEVTIQWGTPKQTLTVAPNQSYALDASGSFVLEQSIPFDYPHDN